MKTKFRRYDVVSYLETDEDLVGYVNAVLEDPTPDLVRLALNNIARAVGLRAIAKQTGIDIKELKRAFLTDDVPSPKTIAKVIRGLGGKAPPGCFPWIPGWRKAPWVVWPPAPGGRLPCGS